MTNYILLPTRGLTASADFPLVAEFLANLNPGTDSVRTMSLKSRSHFKKQGQIQMQVLDSISESGAKLISINQDNLAGLRLSYPGVKLVPERHYSPAWAPKARVMTALRGTAGLPKMAIQITDSSGAGIAGVEVVIFTDYKNRVGKEAKSNSQGIVNVALPAGGKIERLYLYPEHSFWPLRAINIAWTATKTFVLTPIVPSFTDALKYFYKPNKLPVLEGNVTVGVIDTGVGPHKGVTVSGGMNVIQGQDAGDFTDVFGHGTHVAGIIAGNDAVEKFRGVAAGINLRSYRVFADANSDASNFDILKAIDQAVLDQCDLINMSLGGAEEDQAVAIAISDAYNSGVVSFAATGNENRSPVCYPAASQFSIAVSAMGRKGTWPAKSTQQENVKAPFGNPDKQSFIADFSNVGTQVDMVAPGVGIISTYPNDRFAVMDGTSMACPAACGAGARLLAGSPAILGAPRNSERANEMVKLFSSNLKIMGFGSNYEGSGMIKV